METWRYTVWFFGCDDGVFVVEMVNVVRAVIVCGRSCGGHGTMCVMVFCRKRIQCGVGACIYCLAVWFRCKAEQTIVDGRMRVNGACHWGA